MSLRAIIQAGSLPPSFVGLSVPVRLEAEDPVAEWRPGCACRGLPALLLQASRSPASNVQWAACIMCTMPARSRSGLSYEKSHC